MLMGMSGDLQIATVFDGDFPVFEQRGRPNGFRTWSAEFVAECLGYSSFREFEKVMRKAQKVIVSAEGDVMEHFFSERVVEPDGTTRIEKRLTRTACYLIVMNADTNKKQVAQAQYYFARYNEECQRVLDDREALDRLVIRKELSDHEKSLSATADNAGVTDYDLFQNAGYRGMYSLNLSDIKKLKHIPKDRSMLDFMGRTELAANLFRLTQTEERIINNKVKGQSNLEATAEHVGKMVRAVMKQQGGRTAENLPAQEDIRKLKKSVKENGHILKYTGPHHAKELPPPEKYLEAPEEGE